MKSFRTKMSITKLVFLIMIIALCVFTGYYVFTGKDSTEMVVAFISIATVITNYYFKDKEKKEYPDALMKEDEEEPLEWNKL